MTLEFFNGNTIDVSRVIKGGMLDYLHIYTNSITPVEIYALFDDNSEETKMMTVHEKTEDAEDKEITHIYRGYTELYSVQKPFLTSPEGTWMIWMQRPMEVVEDVS